MSSMFRSFASINYRIWFAGALVSNIGNWMQATAQDWVVLTDLTNQDAIAMGITMALQFAPPLLLVPLTGWAADRFDRRKLLLVTQTTPMLLSVLTGTLLLTGVMTLPLMYVMAFAFGMSQAFDAPARQAFVSDIVSGPNVSNAVALNSATFNLSRMIGPAVSGFLIVAVGGGWVFVINAATYLAMILALYFMRVDKLVARVRSKKTGKINEGFSYLATRPDLIVVFVMVFLISAFCMNFPIFASTMALEFGRDADGYGFLSSILAVGSLVGALLAARRAQARMRVVIFAAWGIGSTMLVSAFMPGYVSYATVLVFVGFSVVTVLTTANAYVQTTTDDRLRGRVMAMYMALLMGATPIGAPLIGWVADAFSPRIAIGAGAVAGLLAGAVGLGWLLISGRLRKDRSQRFGLIIDATRPITVIDADPADELGA